MSNSTSDSNQTPNRTSSGDRFQFNDLENMSKSISPEHLDEVYFGLKSYSKGSFCTSTMKTRSKLCYTVLNSPDENKISFFQPGHFPRHESSTCHLLTTTWW
jgi:hypothetical protein